ncbi:ABC transporter permease [Rhodospirillum rubrum]|uniref:Binding-protein-dependent transport systems inner membrane component n=1 Tax=Rhodospirillum rubrum (strain ATCC 11170 / ATH 1.1.1 / DSM 467 / LMG 4362 / NCIMB 8255 / S1) TaxID=269796 RepID=Q2RRR3_RHORT|nr:ABC transporter permease [Rhodospirillum rubrum]ABC23182.1 Binding-protein-dependent transport systems inner membrane component [Rhodospirillum rubrum ATCC 11170]AEO48913.1 binding-protein dependent transport system inner membrane protein [Rhodospirillum rubrum F11]MBK5954822.1 ABC transporter [Rhodospirillum rubrum]QXG79161.1 ABC transporter permease [Rhodospirillum rubrum]HAP98524.1 ABC transporter permease [Rhodospirillum rubrum]
MTAWRWIGRLLPRLLALGVLAGFLARPAAFAPLFAPLAENGAPAIYTQSPLLGLTLDHLRIVALAATLSTLIALPLAVIVTRRAGRAFFGLSRALVNLGQTFPPVAVLAVMVPLVGFGAKPALIALFLYGLLPIFENTLAGLTQVPAAVLDAARGMGMGPLTRLVRIELPLALPLILEGIRVSTIINLGTATIGSTVAAPGLGEVIIAGLLSNNTAFLLQGGLLVALLAVLLHDGLGLIERRVARAMGRFETGGPAAPGR